MFARHPGGEWVRWGEYTCRPSRPSGLNDWDRLLSKAHRAVISAGPLALCLAVLFAALVLLPAAARASGDGGDKQSSADKSAAQADAQAGGRGDRRAQADPTVAAVLAGKDATVESAAWGGTEAQPAGVTLVYRWAATGGDEHRPGVAAAALGRGHPGPALRLQHATASGPAR